MVDTSLEKLPVEIIAQMDGLRSKYRAEAKSTTVLRQQMVEMEEQMASLQKFNLHLNQRVERFEEQEKRNDPRNRPGAVHRSPSSSQMHQRQARDNASRAHTSTSRISEGLSLASPIRSYCPSPDRSYGSSLQSSSLSSAADSSFAPSAVGVFDVKGASEDAKNLQAKVEMLQEQLLVEQKQRQRLATTMQQLRSDLRSQASAFSTKGMPRRSSSAAAIELRMDLSQFETVHTTVTQRLASMTQQLRDREKVMHMQYTHAACLLTKCVAPNADSFLA
jgi:hypothetical protein